jgi:hypothetical protein
MIQQWRSCRNLIFDLQAGPADKTKTSAAGGLRIWPSLDSAADVRGRAAPGPVLVSPNACGGLDD